MSKSWIQKSPSKSNVPYRKTTFKNDFRSGGQKPASHMEAKVAKLPIESSSVLGLQNMKIFLFTINPLFRCIVISSSPEKGTFSYLSHKIGKNCLQKSYNILRSQYNLVFLKIFFSRSFVVDRKKSPLQD